MRLGERGLGSRVVRVLAFTPTYGAGPRQEMLASVRAQVFAGQLIHYVSWHNPFPAPDIRNVLAQFTRGREMALEGGFDALWTVEHDMLVPPDALQKLYDTPAGVVYGVYLFRHGTPVLNTLLHYGPGARNIGESLSLPVNRNERERIIKQRGPYEVSGVGFGCTLIRRDVLKQIPFRPSEDGICAPDIPFATDCLRAGIRQMAHFGVICGHWDGQRWLMPIGGMKEMTRVRALQNVYVALSGGTQELIAGMEYDLPSDELYEIVRAGFVTVIEDPKQPLAAEVKPVERAILPARERAVGHAARG